MIEWQLGHSFKPFALHGPTQKHFNLHLQKSSLSLSFDFFLDSAFSFFFPFFFELLQLWAGCPGLPSTHEHLIFF